ASAAVKMPSFKIPTSVRRAIFSLLIYRYLCDRIVRRRPRTPRPRCNVPRSLVTICRATLEAMEKQGLPKIKWASVTILQWTKRCDATLGLCVHLWRCPKLQRRSIEFANLLGCVFRFHDFCGSRG